jgi:hypothetical protein
VFVTSEVIDKQGINLSPMNQREVEPERLPKPPNAAYSVTISSNRLGQPAPNSVVIQAPPQRSAPSQPTRRRNYEANNAAWSYTKCAILFFTAMLVTWIPSSANRVYSVMHVNEVSVPLEYMSAFVLPLQGFWNAIIYAVTSWKATKMFFGDIAHLFRTMVGRKPDVQELAPAQPAFRRENSFKRMRPGTGRRSNRSSDFDTESTTDLAPPPVASKGPL